VEIRVLRTALVVRDVVAGMARIGSDQALDQASALRSHPRPTSRRYPETEPGVRHFPGGNDAGRDAAPRAGRLGRRAGTLSRSLVADAKRCATLRARAIKAEGPCARPLGLGQRGPVGLLWSKPAGRARSASTRGRGIR
jgi:hypothetical protein